MTLDYNFIRERIEEKRLSHTHQILQRADILRKSLKPHLFQELLVKLTDKYQ